MARIAGIDLPKEKRVEIGLTYVYGIGRKTADDISGKGPCKPRHQKSRILPMMTKADRSVML